MEKVLLRVLIARRELTSHALTNYIVSIKGAFAVDADFTSR